MRHDVAIETITGQPWRIAGHTNTTHQAVCSCGWEGRILPGHEEARANRQADNHRTA